jgi:hypothetical protein
MRLTLFVDSNLFIQCLPLAELDWGRFGGYDEIQLVVTRPVQAEIDKHKDKGGTRLGKRARSTATIFREILRDASRAKMVWAEAPKVELVIRQTLRADPAHAETLSYQFPDDVLVGTAALYAREHPEEEVRVLTHDTGPMASADAIGMQFCEIPVHWLLPPENTEADRKLNQALAEISRLQKAEPSFTIKFLDNDAPASLLHSAN